MKNANANVKKLRSLMKKLPTPAPTDGSDADDPIAMLVQSFLMWETTTDKARTAYQRLLEQVVDFNDLRVSMPFEIVEMIGTRYPKAQERCERLRATLRDIFLREHAVCFDSLREKGKRDVKKYIDSLDGITPYVASRVQLLAFGVHGVPVDEQLRSKLIAEGVAEAEQSVSDLSNWLSRQIKAEDGLDAHHALQAWMDRSRGKTARLAAGRASSGRKKTRTKKKSTRSRSSNSSTKKTAAKATN